MYLGMDTAVLSKFITTYVTIKTRKVTVMRDNLYVLYIYNFVNTDEFDIHLNFSPHIVMLFTGYRVKWSKIRRKMHNSIIHVDTYFSIKF
jgi:hypothetical protein